MIVFSEQWFKLHQMKLLRLANTAIGRYIFGIPKKPNGIIVAITPTGYYFLENIDRGTNIATLSAKLFTGNWIAVNLYKNLKWFWKALHSMDSLILDHQNLVPDFGFETLSSFETLDGPGQSFDDHFAGQVVDSTWAALKAVTEAYYLYSPSNSSYYVSLSAGYSGYGILRRAVCCFYLGTTIAAGADLVSATFTSTCNGGWQDPSKFFGSANGVCIVDADVADPEDQLVVGDWDALNLVGKISDDTHLASTMVHNGEYSYDYNSTGLDAYNDNTNMQVGIMLIGDQQNDTPSYTPTPEGTSTYTQFYTMDNGAQIGSTLDMTWALSSEYFKINVGDSWKDIIGVQINIGDSWKDVIGMKINIGDAWKDIF